jgi:hypothetical protein
MGVADPVVARAREDLLLDERAGALPVVARHRRHDGQVAQVEVARARLL